MWERGAGYWCAVVGHLLGFHAGLDGEGHESLPHGVLWNTTAWAELCGCVSAATGLLWRTNCFGCVVCRGIAFAWLSSAGASLWLAVRYSTLLAGA